MDLAYSDEQRMFADSANEVLTKRALKSDPQSLWPEMAELGWLALPIPEAYGGFGQGAADVGILSECFGRHLVVTPYVASLVLCGRLIASLGTDAQKATLLPGLANGTLTLALAHAERGARHTLQHVTLSASVDGSGWRLSGEKMAAIGADQADRILVTARISGASRDARGIAVFVLEPGQAGLGIDRYDTVDGATAARLTLTDVHLPGSARLGATGDEASGVADEGAGDVAGESAFAALEHAVDAAIAAWCAELLGLMEAATAATIDYTKVRVQFGKPLAANQVLRHRMADMSVHCEVARSMALRAALYVDHADVSERARAVSGAWVKVIRAARSVTEEAIQMHGGMGVTDELKVGLFLKRVLALEALVGGADHHLRRHAAHSARSMTHA
jgi:alkylation response protein AidB-like acyl-CoA dehydrogenase